ncbi:MAG TPA: CBS domain-containing protein [Alphaproteobacteria bacterium]|nr:CBS domain-containing protein [Alphaproteobacteria bacterium]
MKIHQLMTRDVEIASPEDTIQHAAMAMGRIDAGALPVGENDRLVGMITDRDIAVRAVAEGRDPLHTRVRDVMTAEVKYCYEDEDVNHVCGNMAELQLRRLPVIDRQKRLVGILSLGDLAIHEKPSKAGAALQGISQPGGQHCQTAGAAAQTSSVQKA